MGIAGFVSSTVARGPHSSQSLVSSRSVPGPLQYWWRYPPLNPKPQLELWTVQQLKASPQDRPWRDDSLRQELHIVLLNTSLASCFETPPNCKTTATIFKRTTRIGVAVGNAARFILVVVMLLGGCSDHLERGKRRDKANVRGLEIPPVVQTLNPHAP